MRKILPIAICILLAGTFYLVGLKVGSQGTVGSFNDGFSDSKLDDCQQGYLEACKWLQGVSK